MTGQTLTHVLSQTPDREGPTLLGHNAHPRCSSFRIAQSQVSAWCLRLWHFSCFQLTAEIFGKSRAEHRSFLIELVLLTPSAPRLNCPQLFNFSSSPSFPSSILSCPITPNSRVLPFPPTAPGRFPDIMKNVRWFCTETLVVPTGCCLQQNKK